jgi:hypothetical protein
MLAERQARRLQRIVVCAAAFTLALAGHWLWDGEIVVSLRAGFWMWCNDYHGCTCGDCIAHFAQVDPMRYRWYASVPLLGYGDRDELGLIAGAYGMTLLLIGALGRGMLLRLARLVGTDPLVCAFCGYSRDGLPRADRCPECGRVPRR